MLVPLWLPKVVAIACAAVYVLGTDARLRSKLVIVALVVLSLFLQRGGASPVVWTIGLLLQLAVAVSLLVYFRLPR